MTDQPAAEMERDPKADDQMVALALAKLAIERPGWLWTLRGLAKARGFLDHFEGFREIHADTAVLATAAERDRLLEANEGLVKALEGVMSWMPGECSRTVPDEWVAAAVALDEASKP